MFQAPLGYPRKVPDRVQIDTTQKRQKTTENQNAMGRQPSLSRTDVTKYYKKWLEEGIPGPQAERLQLPPVPGAEGFVIYKWHREGT